jgi:hypothetical protein
LSNDAVVSTQPHNYAVQPAVHKGESMFSPQPMG